jgi:hypothetical protein
MSVKSWLAGIFASVVLVASMAGTVIAQPPGGGRGGPGGGMRGGMMMGGGGGGGVMSMLNLLRIERVATEVKVTDEEKAALEKIGEKVREMMAPPAGGGGAPRNPRDMSEDERKKMMDDMRARMEKMNEVAREELESILPPEKVARLVGIYAQNNGMQQLLTNPLVTEELTLTDDQKKDVTKKGEESAAEMQTAIGEMFAGGGGGDRSAMQAKMEELRKKIEDKYSTILTDEQKKKLEEMKGAEFKLTDEEKGRGMFGGGRGGPGGGRGGRGGDAGGPPAGGRGQRPGGDIQ